jgi:hypothetical protein
MEKKINKCTITRTVVKTVLFLEVINLDEQIVRCPYLVKNKCLIK